MADQAMIDQINKMRSQNMSNDEIAQRLLYLGYTNAQVFDALSQADAVPAYENNNSQEYVEMKPSYNYQQQDSHIDSSKVEEIAESIIEDKWNDLVESVNKIVDWKSSMEVRLGVAEEQIKAMRTDFESLQRAILGKISDSDAVMRDVSVDIKALEQVFKKILPGFVENVNELSRITSKMKGK